MKVQIRLLKSWKNGDKEWPEGQMLDIEKVGADQLIEKEIAEIYEARAGDIIEVSPIQADSGLSKQMITDVVNDVMAKNSQFQQNLADEGDPILKTGGFESIGHFVREAKRVQCSTGYESEQMKQWLNAVAKAPSGMNEGIDEDGGFLVPDQFRNTLLRNVVDATVFLPRATIIPMATNVIEIPAVIESSRATSIYGGIIIYRPAEGGSITASNPKVGRVRLELSKLAALTYVTSELLEDSPISVEPMITTQFGEAMGFQMDEDIVNGTGVHQSRGIMNCKSLVTVDKETDQEAATIVTQNILKMYSRLRSRSQRTAFWSANNDAFPQLATLSLPVGTGGAPAGLLQVSTDGVTGEPKMTLLGRPLFLTEHNQTVGTTGDLILSDMRQYLVGQKAGGGVKTASSIHLKFDQDEVAFRFIMRMDGNAWESSALTPKHSSSTLSSFVALQSRS